MTGVQTCALPIFSPIALAANTPHGIGGITGTLLCGVFAAKAIGATAGLIEGHPQQLLTQFYGVIITLIWTAVATFVLLKLVGAFAPLRVSMQQELEGLDISAAWRGAAVAPLSKYRFPALPVGMIMPRHRHAHDLGTAD